MIPRSLLRENARIIAAIVLAAQVDAQRAVELGREDLLPHVCNRYRNMACAVAARYYTGIRAAQIGGRYSPVLAPAIAPESFWIAARGSNTNLPRSVGLLAQLGFRDTLDLNANRDSRQPRFARVPQGSEPCEFCVMLASRGFVYRSEAAAMGRGGNGVHADCKCAIVPSWESRPRVEGYNPAAFFGEFDKAAKAAGSRLPGETSEDFTRRVLSVMRSQRATA